MIQSFADRGTEDVFYGRRTQAARRSCPERIWSVAGTKLDQLDSASSVNELRAPPGNRLEALTGRRRGQYSIRINRRYRICFTWSTNGPRNVEIVDYH